jgi:integrase
MPSIPELRANKDGVYYAHWSDARRSKRKSMGTSDPRVAKERFAQWLLVQDQAVEADGTTFTAAECWAVYEKLHIRKEVASPATLAFAWARLEPHFGAKTIPEINQNLVDAYVRERLLGKNGRAVKAPTVRRELQALFAALRFCAAPPRKLFPPALIEAVTLPDGGQPRDRWLTHAEIQRMLDAAARLRRGPRLSRGERFLWIALHTAARMSAVLDLTWDRVDFETRVIHLDVPERKKTKKRRASVPISTDLLPVLQRAYKERQGVLVMDNKADVWATVQLIAIEAGLGGGQKKPDRTQKPKATGISPHVLRHTAATHMARRGVPLWKIAKVLGNTLAMVEKVYAKHSPDDLREAVDLIGGGQLEAAE